MGAVQSFEEQKVADIPLTEEEIAKAEITSAGSNLSYTLSESESEDIIIEPNDQMEISSTIAESGSPDSSETELNSKEINRKDWARQEKLRKRHKRKRVTVPGPRCKAKTRKGRQCKKAGDPYCDDHQPKVSCFSGLEEEVERRFHEILNLDNYGQLESYIRSMVQLRRNIEASLTC